MKAAITELCIGQTASQAKVFTNADVERYSELTSDFNEVYDRNAEIWKKHYKRAVVPGLLVEGLLNQVISTQLPGGPCVMLQKELVFLYPVHVGDKITVELEIIDINKERNWITQKVNCFNDQQFEVIRGQVVLLLF